MKPPRALHVTLAGRLGWLVPAPGVRLHATFAGIIAGTPPQHTQIKSTHGMLQWMPTLACVATDRAGDPRSVALFSRH